MKKYLRNILLIAYAFLFTINQNIASESYPQIEVKTTSGSFIIELDRNRAPISVENFLRYIEDDFFESKNVVLSNSGMDCVLPDGKVIEYVFSSGEMLRKVDGDEWTIEVDEVNIETLLNSLKQKETNGLVDEIKLEFKMPNEKQSYIWRVNKQYGFSDFWND